MYQVPQVSEQIYYVGVNDRNKELFENIWALPQGISYNSYLLVGDVTVLIDTVDICFADTFFQKIERVLGERPVDYLIINHIEPDHGGAIGLLRQRYPDVQIIGNKKTFQMLQGFHQIEDNLLEVKGGSELELGNFKFSFVLAPMVHWPEVMFTYEASNQALFSADAFGTFGALHGHLFDYQYKIDDILGEMHRYYSCIIGKYGNFVQKALKNMDKAGLEPKFVCSTHGPIWTEHHFAEARAVYDNLSRNEAEEGVVLLYGSMYGNTEQIADIIAQSLSASGIKNIVCHNVSKSTSSQILCDVFRYKGLIIGSPTYCGELFTPIENILNLIRLRDLKERVYAVFGSYTWAPASIKKLKPFAEEMKWELIGDGFELKMADTESVLDKAWTLGEEVAKAVLKNEETTES